MTSARYGIQRQPPEPQRDCLPLGYARNFNLNRERIEKNAIKPALDAAKVKLTVAADRLGVNSAVLAADLRHHHIHLPLSAIASRRLGATRIAAIREALGHGVPKSRIEQLHNVSEWSLLLIELDQHELSDVHREATAVRQGEKHRDALLSFLRDMPGESRRAFAKRYAASYDWLQKYDHDWLFANLPESRVRYASGKRGPHKDWHPLDQAASMAVQLAARQELARPDRPMRLTRSRLLFAAGASAAISHKGRARYPSAVAEAERLSETKEQFMRRMIRWALQKCAEQHFAISIKRLRPFVCLSTNHLKKHLKYLIEVAAELGLTFDARSRLAP